MLDLAVELVEELVAKVEMVETVVARAEQILGVGGVFLGVILPPVGAPGAGSQVVDVQLPEAGQLVVWEMVEAVAVDPMFSVVEIDC